VFVRLEVKCPDNVIEANEINFCVQNALHVLKINFLGNHNIHLWFICLSMQGLGNALLIRFFRQFLIKFSKFLVHNLLETLNISRR